MRKNMESKKVNKNAKNDSANFGKSLTTTVLLALGACWLIIFSYIFRGGIDSLVFFFGFGGGFILVPLIVLIILVFTPLIYAVLKNNSKK